MSKHRGGLTSIKGLQYTSNLIVYDDEYLKSSSDYAYIGKELDKCIKEYVSILTELSNLTEGQFSQGLKAFADLTSSLANDIINEITSQLALNMNNYISSLDSADGDWI